MRLVVVGSGSKGNALIVEFGATRIAVDAGFRQRRLAARLKAAEIAPQSVSACVVTHEHGDHACGALAARKKWHWKLIATPPTLEEIGAAAATEHICATEYRAPVMVGDVRVTLLHVSHDAVSPAAVLLEDTASGARVGVAYDLGEFTETLARDFARLDILVIEANHDMAMLRAGPYPPVLQDRVAGKHGHLSNLQAAAFATRVAHKDLRAVVLAHLSEQNNTPEVALFEMRRALRRTPFRGALLAAGQHARCEFGEPRTSQLSFL